MRYFGITKSTRFVTVFVGIWVVDSLYFGKFSAVLGVGFPDSVSPPQMTRRSGEARLHPLVFLQIRNNSNRCWKAIEHLILMRKCSWKWRFCGSRITGTG